MHIHKYTVHIHIQCSLVLYNVQHTHSALPKKKKAQGTHACVHSVFIACKCMNTCRCWCAYMNLPLCCTLMCGVRALVYTYAAQLYVYNI